MRKIGSDKWGDIETSIRKLHSDALTAGRPLDAIALDNLNFTQHDDHRLNDLQAKKQITDNCKHLAMELGILIILLAQLNKEGVRSDKPDASHISGLTGIPAAANLVLGINIPDDFEENDKPMFRIATLAHRNGPAGKIATYDRTPAGRMVIVNEFPY